MKTSKKVKFKDLPKDTVFLATGGMYKKLDENTAFYFNAHNEIEVKDVEAIVEVV